MILVSQVLSNCLQQLLCFNIASGCPAVVKSASASTASDRTAPNGFVLQKSGSTVYVLSVLCIYVHVHSPEMIAGVPQCLLTYWQSCHGGWVTGDSTGAFAGLSPNF